MTPRRRPQERRTFVVTLLAFGLWTAATAAGLLDRLDASVRVSAVDPRSTGGQLAEGFALLTHPFGLFALIGLLAVWAHRRRLRRLALALGLSTLGLPTTLLVRELEARPRPPSPFVNSVSATGPAYPAGHLVAATIIIWVAVTIADAQRKSGRSRWTRRIGGTAFVAAVATDQWALSTQWQSDIVGGILLGATVAAGALWLSGADAVRRSAERQTPPVGQARRRAAVVYNPTKVLDLALFRRRVEHALRQDGWEPPLWFETTRDDPGRRMAQDAVAQGAALVLVAGGDGTVRAACAALVGSGVPVGLVPAGTGNLLCRNLGIPLDEDVAIDVALHGVPAPVDMVTCTTDAGSGSFAVMSGIGLDAQIMSGTRPELKRALKGGAYVVAAAQQVHTTPFRVRVTLDDQELPEQSAVMVLVGNVGRLQGGIPIFPSASPTDGLLDVLIASADGLLDWARVAARMRHRSAVRGLARAQGRRVQIVTDGPIAFQLDGDTEGVTTHVAAEVAPGALLVMLPLRERSHRGRARRTQDLAPPAPPAPSPPGSPDAPGTRAATRRVTR